MSYYIISREIEDYTPDQGFNLVGIDPHGMPGESLYLIGHFDTYEEALKEKRKYGNNTVIYYREETGC